VNPDHHIRVTVVLAALASLALSAWGAWAAFIPNPDAALYLRSAELIVDGRWVDALHVYGWPAYSAVIALLMKLSGCEALPAAQTVNAVFAVVTTVAFIGLVHRLAGGDRVFVACAAIFILMQPQLTQLRATVVRDNGYLAFFVLSLYWVAADLAQPRRSAKLAIAGAILAAGLFRIEGFFLALWVILYHQIPYEAGPGIAWIPHAPTGADNILRTGYVAVTMFFLLSISSASRPVASVIACSPSCAEG